MNHLDAILAFARVAELNSFTAAAASLGLTKSSVSAAVQQLEARLKVQLFYRTTRRVQLTHDGQAYYERAREMLADLDDMDSMFQTAKSLTGTLRVDMSVAAARNHVIPRLPEFLDRHPGLSIELSSTDRRVDVVAEGFDCVLRVGAVVDSTLVARPLGVMQMVNVAARSYLERFGVPETLEDLSRHRLIHYSLQFGAKPHSFEYWDGTEYRVIDMDGVITVNNTEAYHAALMAGLGINQSPSSSVRARLADGSLVEVLPQYRAEPLPVTLIYPRRRHQARRVRVFMDWLADILQDMLD
ncbi:MAG: LysR family transcriptional regulator [Asticcacaulis sp.]|nr:LysR family transcriptional regulator [Asticcacaulis sp.]